MTFMVFNYVRVSSLSQNTDRQLVGVEFDREFIEKVSAKDTDRPKLQSMLRMLREGDLVNVHELSRLARNTKDLLDIVEQILSVGASIKFYKENLEFKSGQKKDAFQSLMLTMLGAIAQFERDLLLERQREGIEIAKQKGKYLGRRTKFSEKQLKEIKEKFNAKSVNKSDLAKEYGITRQYLYELVKKSHRVKLINHDLKDSKIKLRKKSVKLKEI